MLLIRDIFYCKPGKVKTMVEKFLAMKKLGKTAGMPDMRVLTDVSGERYWTIVSEMEVESFDKFMKMDMGGDAATMKEMEKLMSGYHELVDHGRREIFKIEG